MINKCSGIGITGISAAVSNNWTSLDSFITDENDEKIIKKFMKSTGVRGRYNAGEKQTSADFCFVAARELLKKKNVAPEEIGILVLVTQTADYMCPASACVLQYRLGIQKDCLCFDVNLGCSGFSCGVNIVAGIMKTNNIKKGLLLCGDTSAKRKKISDVMSTRTASMLFGDSGTATLIEKVEESTVYTSYKTDGSRFKAIINPYEGWRNPYQPENLQRSSMDDLAVFDFSTSDVPDLINEFCDEMGTSSEDYDCLVLHQANMMILKQIAKKTGFTMGKTLISLDEYGNTSSASIPITLVKNYGEKNESLKIHALMCGFGVGLSWSVVDVCINAEDIFSLIHTDEYFEDGFYVE